MDLGKGEIEDDKGLGEAIQLQLTAFVAFGRAKGKGKGKPKGKGKGHQVQQRRKRLSEIKAKSKCLRCGAYGHWAGDPICKFPGPGAKGNANAKDSKLPSNPPKPTAHFADFSDSSSDEGIFLSASSPKTPSCKHGHQECSCPFKGTQFGASHNPVGRNDPSKPIGSNTKFKFGQFKGKTFWEILHVQPDYFAWTQKNAKSPRSLRIC